MDIEVTDDWRYCSNLLGVELFDEEALGALDEQAQEQVLDFIARHEVDAIVASDTRCTRLLLRLRSELPASVACFPMPTAESFEELYDKARFSQWLYRESLPQPRTVAVDGVEALAGINLPMPAIAKPTQGEGGEQIESADSIAELERIFEIQDSVNRTTRVVQELIPGRDIDLSILADHGQIVAWTIQQVNPDGEMEFLTHPDVLALGHEMVSRSNYHGVVHIDLRVDERDDSIVFIEANPRFWGSLCYSVWSGVNFLELGLRLARSESVESAFAPATGVCPYLGVTRRYLPQILLGGRPMRRGLSEAQQEAWRFHHRFGSGGIRTWMATRLRG